MERQQYINERIEKLIKAFYWHMTDKSYSPASEAMFKMRVSDKLKVSHEAAYKYIRSVASPDFKRNPLFDEIKDLL